ncbi:unnamed protein product [Boreogadus saida]
MPGLPAGCWPQDGEVKTCMSCQRFERVKTEAPELKPIKPKSPWHMIATDFFTKWVEARPIKDKTAIATSQVIANIQKAQERQKEAYKRRSKRGTKRFRITPGMEVLKKNERKRGRHGQTMDPDWPTVYRVTEVTDNNLVQLETLDGKPLKTRTPYASVKPVRRRSQAAWPTKETVSDLYEPADSELKEDPLEDLDVVIISVQPGRAYPASLSKRVEGFRAMLSNPSTRLDDRAMDHAQALLKAKYPNVNGLYATTSLALLSTLPEPAQGGEGPTTVIYHQGRMRSYLCSCFQAGEVQLFPRAMRSPTAEPFAIDVDVHCLCRRTIRQGKAPLVPCRRL